MVILLCSASRGFVWRQLAVMQGSLINVKLYKIIINCIGEVIFINYICTI